MKTAIVDDFCDVSSWLPVASGEACLDLSSEARERGWALRMDFDFKGGGGFVVARKEISMPLPEAYAFRFWIGGEAPPNKFEFKLVDPSGRNVWRWQQEAFDFAPKGRALEVSASQMEFAWGPAGGGRLRELGAVEFAISAGPGGAGFVWIAEFLFEDRTVARPPRVTASTCAWGDQPENVLAPDEPTTWRSAPGDPHPWLRLDFHQPREYGGIIVNWDAEPATRAFTIEASDDALEWRPLHHAEDDRRRRSFIGLPGTQSRFLRLRFETPAGVRGLEVQPFDFSRSPIEFFHYVAAAHPRGWFPRYLSREQSYWTCAGVPEGSTCALLNEEGMVEPDKGTFSLEPFLEIEGRFLSWADASTTTYLEPDGVPIPTARWKLPEAALETTAFATGSGDRATLFVRYRIGSLVGRDLHLHLHVAIRPFQVNPPWQAWRGLGGISEIRDLRFDGAAVWVNGDRPVVPLSRPCAFGAATFEQGAIVEFLAEGRWPEAREVQDATGFASGAMGFEVDLPAGARQEIFVAVPFGVGANAERVREIAALDGAAEFESAVRALRERLCGVEMEMPDGVAREAAETFRTAAGQILINRDGPALQPGPRRYTRAWIRDGVIMGAALLRIGDRQALPDFLHWFAPHQREDGFVPCCVDRSGPDWLVEHDSHGQLIYGVREAFRFTGDRAFLDEMWPYVRKAARFIERLRAGRLTPEFKSPEKRDRYGLLPESASHEGYLAHPVHAYWDDFWALRGLTDAAAIAAELGHQEEAADFAELVNSFRETLRASICAVIERKGLRFIPGSVEWADFDPTATANAVALLQGMDILPEEPLEEMFDLFVRDFRRKRSGELDWNNYTAYEIRIIDALVHLGRRTEALEMLEFFLSDRRPLGWNQWPEISWRDPRSPGHLGDLPHTWIASEFMLVFAHLFAYEREEDDALILGSGVDDRWLNGRGIALRKLPTWFGKLDFAMRRDAEGSLQVEIGGDLRLPRGGFVLRPPGGHPIRSLSVNGAKRLGGCGAEAKVFEFPARVILEFKTAGA